MYSSADWQPTADKTNLHTSADTSAVNGTPALTVIANIDTAQSTADAADAKAVAAQENLNAYAAATDSTLGNLQSQIDGSITTWFYAYVPTASNVPASGWTTVDAKNQHLGDLFYDTSTGYSYRWQLVSDVYSWARITDTDVTKALADAAKAQDTADSKRRTFVAQPTPPYDVGDLWAQGTSGDLMRCSVAKAAGTSYSESDWIKAAKYTDDAAANAAQSTANNAQASATAAQQTADVTKQHFYADTEGAHVTSGESDSATGSNLLMTSAKVALRHAAQEVMTITENAISFLSGLGSIVAKSETLTNPVTGATTTINGIDVHSPQLSSLSAEATNASGAAWHPSVTVKEKNHAGNAGGCIELGGHYLQFYDPFITDADQAMSVDMEKAMHIMAAPVYITSTGASGGWTWRKWSDGKVELFGGFTDNTSFSGSSEGNYLATNITKNFPFTFSDVKVAMVQCQYSEMMVFCTGKTTSSISYRGWSWYDMWGGSSVSVNVGIYVQGTV